MTYAWTVYPRVCGGTRMYCPMSPISRGLSPRVRGNRAPGVRARVPVRSIPACAGEPLVGGCCLAWGWVYPRVCGGTDHFIDGIDVIVGLSPRVRGNRCLGRFCAPLGRSIPACAGEPSMLRLLAHPNRVYPRVCGGTSAKSPAIARRRVYPRVCGGTTPGGGELSGLSPRVRGSPQLSSPRDLGLSPRVRGNLSRSVRERERSEGLSPRVRGNPAFNA